MSAMSAPRTAAGRVPELPSVAQWSATTCTEETACPNPINSSDAPTGDVSPALSRDGNLLYFASDRPGGKGKLDLWVIQTIKLKAAKGK